MSEHVAIISPDARGRFHLLKWIGRGMKWRVFASEDGMSIRLEAVQP